MTFKQKIFYAKLCLPLDRKNKTSGYKNATYETVFKVKTIGANIQNKNFKNLTPGATKKNN